MLRAIWISDPHFAHNGDVLGHDPRIRIQAAIDHINRRHADASFCVVSGDMVNRGAKADYEGLRSYLDELAIPVLPMVGNHDDRALLRQTFPLPTPCMSEFVQYSVLTSEGLVVCLDSQKHGSDAGEFCKERTTWLRDVLETAAEMPVYLFMHHPPHRLGLPMQDSDKMENGDAFLDLVSSFENVKYLFIGHVHRPISGTIRGLPFSTMRSALYQAPAPRPEWDWHSFKPSEEAPNLGVITITNMSVTVQYEQFCTFEKGGH
ncbi:MAG: phosphodiesterase [Pseudomonadota bacterium]